MANPVNGKEYLLYVNAASEPATPDEITNYTLVGLMRNTNFTDSSERITSSNKDNGSRTTTLAGDQSFTLTGEVEWGHDSDAGQEIIWDAVKTTTSANKLVYFLLTSDVTSDIQVRGSGNAVSWDLGTPNNDIATASFELAGNGDYTKEAVDA
jgi:hypothetical protein